MRLFLVGLLLALAALTTPLSASAMDLQEMKDTVRSLGCTAAVSSIPSYGFNAYYNPRDHSITMIGADKLPENWQRLILLHETGHCLQFQNNEWQALRAAGPYELEWDADAFAIRQLDALYGIDGAELNAEIWSQLYRQYGFEGDLEDSHGLSVERITRGNLNRVRTIVQAP